MKKLASLLVVVFCCCSGLLHADVFASRIRISNPDGSPFDGKFNDGSGLKVSFVLNDTATAVELKFYQTGTNAVVASVLGGALGAGEHSMIWTGAGSSSGAKYYVKIEATQKPRSADSHSWFYFNQTADHAPLISRGIYTRGVDINNNMDTRGFGYWYASNADPGVNDGYRLGTLRYNADGSFAGTGTDGHPILVKTLGTANGGTFDWGGTAPWSSAVDSKGRIYQVSNGGNFVTRLDNDSAAPKIIIRNITAPRGLYCVGSGASLKIYIAADTMVWRADIGNSDTLSIPLVAVLAPGAYCRDVVIDDGGALFVTLRTGAAGTAPGYVERYDISGSLPKKRTDAQFSVTHSTGQPVCFALEHGPDRNSASDDTVYYSIRGLNGSDTNNIGIHQITGIEGAFPEAKRIFKSGDVPGSLGGNNNATADIALDWAGNIVWFENANEEIFMIAPPRAGATVTRATKGYDTISVTNSLSVNPNASAPHSFSLEQNYPNPFNPSTVISYTLPANGRVTLTVVDILGNVVTELYRGEASEGFHAVTWNATNSSGLRAASGMYLYRISAELSDGRTMTETKRMLLLK